MAYSNKPMRRSALIGPWGVGAIVPFPNDESLMIAGLDMWRYNDAIPFIIKDERLQRRLGVQELRWPPDFREKNADPQNWHFSTLGIKMAALLFRRPRRFSADITQTEKHTVCQSKRSRVFI